MSESFMFLSYLVMPSLKSMLSALYMNWKVFSVPVFNVNIDVLLIP